MEDLNNLAKATMKSSLFLFVGLSASTILLAINSIIIARLLGPENYGLYTVIMIVPTLFIALSDFGISPTLTKFIASNRVEGKNDETFTLIRTGFMIKILLIAVISTILWITSDYLAIYFLSRPEIGPMIRLSVIYLIGQASTDSLNATFIGQDEAGKSGVVMIINAASRFVISPFLILMGLGVSGAVLGMGIGSVLASIVGVVLLLLILHSKIQHDMKKGSSPMNPLKMFVIFGSPLYMSAILLSFQNELRRIFLAFFTTDEKIGNFSTAINFSSLMNVLTTPVASSLFPAFSKIDIDKDKKSLEKMFKISIKYMSLVIVPVIFYILFLSKDLIELFYGSQYKIAAYYLSLYILTFFLAPIGMYVIEAFLNSQEKTMTTLKMKIINFITFVPLSLIFIPLYEPPGLIISIFISQFISLIYGLINIYKNYHLNIDWNISFKILISSALSILPVFILQYILPLNNIIIKMIVSVSIFSISLLICLPLTGTLNKDDIINIKNLSDNLPFIRTIINTLLKIEIKILNINI